MIDLATDFFKDPRVESLAADLGEALELVQIRLIRLWAFCRDEGKRFAIGGDMPGWVVPDSVANAMLKSARGAEALLANGCDELALGVRISDGRIYLRGSERTVRNLLTASERARKGGVANAEVHRSAPEAPVEHRPSTTQAPSEVPPRYQQECSEGASSTPQAPLAGAPREPFPRSPSPVPLPEIQTPGSPALARDEADVTARRQLGDNGWTRLNAIRASLAAELGWTDVRALHPQDPGRRELAARLREATDPAGDLAHVLAIAEAEARDKQTPEYLSGSMFEERPWRKKLAMRVADVTRRPPQGAPPRGGGGYRAGESVFDGVNQVREELRRKAAT